MCGVHAEGALIFVLFQYKAGSASGKCTPGVVKVWERVPSTFLERTTLDLDNCVPYWSPSQSLKGSTLCIWSELVVHENFVLDDAAEWNGAAERGAWRPLVGQAFPAGV